MKYFKKFVFVDAMGKSYYHIYRTEKFLFFFTNEVKCTSFPLVKESANFLINELNDN